ncbi:Pentatricopeptide repeat [Cinnamomum micranthum f. kanehirae]|uniref:Pentatricopeptide repeat n=1 Tax=Cinnamomum micranthum f. kanehirae TaxID=337451 RepID=A0A3S3NFR0_9MAGN|nr:Pentatricopeptide repeat [Cinnamomum micranthum f. kanehirae]
MPSSSFHQLHSFLSRFNHCLRSLHAVNHRTQLFLSTVDHPALDCYDDDDEDEVQLLRCLSTRSLQQARHLLDKMPQRRIGRVLGKQLHAHIILNGLDDDDYDGRLLKSLIYMYSKFGIMDAAHYLFGKCSDSGAVESLNTMINGYIQIGQLEKARSLFYAVPFPDTMSWTSMITGYFHSGDTTEACRLFSWMPKRDAISWTAMISGHVQNELFTEAIEIFQNMRVVGVSPLDSTYSTLLGAVGAMAHLELGKQFHCLLSKVRFKFDMILDNSLISMYGKCGDIDSARCIFDRMISRDVISWNSMIIGLSHHGLANEVLKVFETMQDTGMKPNSVTFLGVLSACSHTGMVDRGWELFHSMTREHSICPEVQHYICMIDLLGRAGKVTEAEEFIKRLPFEPGLAIWGALLGVCNLRNSNMAVAERTAIHVLELDPCNAPAHVLLCNMYAANHHQKEERMLRKEMGLKGVRKSPGCSWILLKGRVHIFMSGDRSHPQSNEVDTTILGLDDGEQKKCLYSKHGYLCGRQRCDVAKVSQSQRFFEVKLFLVQPPFG